MKYHRHIYVDAQALFDVRQGLLAKIHTEFAVDVTLNNAYYEREDNTFTSLLHGQIDHGNFQELYRLYKEDALEYSHKTKILLFVKQLITQLLKQNAAEGVELWLGIEINAHPFKLSDEEKAEIKNAVSDHFQGMFEVNMIDVDPRLIRMAHASERYIAMVFYDYIDWVNSNEFDFKQTKSFTQTSLYVPRLYFNGIPPKEELDKLEKEGVDPFVLWERTYSPIFSINYLPVAFYCIDAPANAPELTQPI